MRYPSVSGSFYPAAPDSLARLVNEMLAKARKAIKPIESIAAVCPHAGFVYSGLTAAHTFAALEPQLKKPDTTVIFIGPNHTGLGDLFAVSFDDWMTPVGKSMCDLKVAGALAQTNPLMRNEAAHFKEHSIEVQLPFLQTINPAAKIVCICMMEQGIDASQAIGQAIGDVVKSPEFKDRNFVVIASSDFTHYMQASAAEELDMPAINDLLSLNDEAFQRKVLKKSLSICGHGPIAAAAAYAKLAGAKGAKLLRYTNSGKETGSSESEIVAYASLVFL